MTVVLGRSWSIPARTWTAIAFLGSMAGDVVQFLMGQRGINNLWVVYLSTATTGLLVLKALANWQVSRSNRRRLHLALLGYVVMWAILMRFDDPQRFSALAVPFHSILVLFLCLFTLVSNALEARDQPLVRQDWFWACLGLALLYGGASAMQPLLRVFMEQNQIGEVVSVLSFKAGLQIVAMLLITAGMLCPLPAPSGSSSSPAR